MERKPLVEVYAPRPTPERSVNLTFSPQKAEAPSSKPPVPTGGSGVHVPLKASGAE